MIIHKEKIFLSLLIILLMGYDTDAKSFDFSLNQCLRYALQNSYTIKKSNLKILEADYIIDETGSGKFPQINGFAKTENYPSLAEQYVPGELFGQPGETVGVTFGKSNFTVGGVKVEQLIYDRKFWTGIIAAKTSKEFYELNSIKTEEDVIFNTAALFYQVKILDEQKKSLSANIKKLEEVVRVSRLQYEQEIIKQSDYENARINLSNLIVDNLSIEKNIIEAENNLKLLIGFPLNDELNLISQKEITPNFLINDISVITPTEIKLLQKKIELQEVEQASVSAGYWPSLYAFANYSYQSSTDDYVFFDDDAKWNQSSAIGLNLSVPIFDGFRKKYKSEQAEVKMKSIEEELKETREKFIAELRTAKIQLEKSIAAVEVQKDNVERADDVYDQMFLQYKEGISTLVELLDSESTLRGAKTSLNSSMLDLKIAELSLLKYKGQIKTLLEKENK